MRVCIEICGEVILDTIMLEENVQFLKFRKSLPLASLYTIPI